MKKKGYISILVAAMIWGGSFVVTSYALIEIPVMSTLTIRFLGASIILAIIGYKTIINTSVSDLIRTIPLGVVLFLAFYFKTKGNAGTTIANNSFLTATNVIFTPFIAKILLKSKPNKSDYIASIISLISVSLLMFTNIDFTVNKGDLFSLVGAVFFSLHVVYSTKVKDVNTISTTFIQTLVAGLIALSVSFFANDFSYINNLTIKGKLSMGYLIIFSTLIGYLLQLYASKILPPSAISVVLSTEALFATVFGIILLGERLTIKSSISMILLIIAVIMSSYKEDEQTITTGN